MENIKKVVGTRKDEAPLSRLARINRGLKKIGCVSNETPPMKYKRIVGRKVN